MAQQQMRIVPPITMPQPSEADALYRRLETGWQRIDEAKAAGLDTTSLDEFFVVLLRKYEAACDAEAAR